jgi:hypothetical protein
MIREVVSTVCGNVEIVTRFCAAISAGTPQAADILAYADWFCDAYQSRDDGLRINSGERIQVRPYAGSLSFATGLLRYGKTYLGTIQNDFGSTDVLVNPDEVPEGELLVLDVGTNMLLGYKFGESQGHTEHQILMVVHVLVGRDLVQDTLYKVGTTSSVFIPAFDKASRAKDYKGIVVEDKLERYRIGGALCSYCHPAKE